MKIGGIDGCRAGWILILNEQNKYKFGGVFPSISELYKAHPNLDRTLIDIPMGLSSENFVRNVDKDLRKELIPRYSTVFSVPCRKAIYAENYKDAKQINLKIEQKSISIQSWNIANKIKEVDQYLNQRDEPIPLYEGHPELCFKNLNNGTVLMTHKSSKEGRQERLSILEKNYPKLGVLYCEILKHTKRKEVKRDDILDAMALCVMNFKTNKDLKFLKNNPLTDSNGIETKIAYL